MERFLKRYADRIVGSIAGFDRMLFRGSLLSICHRDGMATGGARAQVPAPLLLLSGWGIGVDAHSLADWAADDDSGVLQRSRVVGPADGSRRHRF
jgi:hypothetical protein